MMHRAGSHHFGHGFGPRGGFPFGPSGGPYRRGRKARRGDIRTAALLLLAEEPRNGYQIMQALGERTGGAWRPSAGSVYPALQQLEDEGLVEPAEDAGRKLLTLTDDGRRLVAERGESQPAPWEHLTDDVSDESWALVRTMREIDFALFQLMSTGSQAQRAEARALLDTTRRELYRMLADGGDPGADAPDGGARGAA